MPRCQRERQAGLAHSPWPLEGQHARAPRQQHLQLAQLCISTDQLCSHPHISRTASYIAGP